MTDSPLHPALFRQSAVAENTTRLNDALVDLMTGLPDWWNVGAEATREARRQGRGPFPPAIKSPRARTIFIQGRDGNEIPLRLSRPLSRAASICISTAAAGYLVQPTRRTRCWSISPTIPASPSSVSNTAWRRKIPIPPDLTTANPPPHG